MAATPAIAHAQFSVIDYNGGTPNGFVGNDIFNDVRSAAKVEVTGDHLSFNRIRFWAILEDIPEWTNYAPTMFWQLLKDNGGIPDNSMVQTGGYSVAAASNAVDFDSPGSGFKIWQFDFTVSDQYVPTGSYWLALHDNVFDEFDPGSYTNSNMIWALSSINGPYMAESVSPDDVWAQHGEDGLAFQLLSPEPGSIVLMATGFVGILGISRRRRKIAQAN